MHNYIRNAYYMPFRIEIFPETRKFSGRWGMKKLIRDFEESRKTSSTRFKSPIWEEDDADLWEDESLEGIRVWEREFERGAEMAGDEPFVEQEEEWEEF